MKNISKGVLVFFVVLVLVLSYSSDAKAVSSTDQECSLVGTDYDLISSGTTPREQSFIPTQNRLEMVHTWLNGPGFAGDQDVKVTILDSAKNSVGYSVYSPTFTTEEPQIRTAEFNPALVLTPGQIYYIQVDVLDGPHNLYWYRSSGECYNRGNATTEGAAQPWDFLFQTYGFTYTEPESQPTPQPASTPADSVSSSSTSSSSSNATGQTATATAPKTTTSASIAVPSDPQAAYDDINKSAFFSWKASATADVEGYIISRSEDGTTFTDLGAVSKDITSYSDKNVTEGKTYYYQVKAYKGTVASPVSVIVSVAIPKNTAATATDIKTEGIKEESFFTTRNILFLSAGIIVLALTGTLIYLRRKNKTVKSPSTEEHKAE